MVQNVKTSIRMVENVITEKEENAIKQEVQGLMHEFANEINNQNGTLEIDIYKSNSYRLNFTGISIMLKYRIYNQLPCL